MSSNITKPLKPLLGVGGKILEKKTDEFLLSQSTGGREPWRTLLKIKRAIQETKRK